MAVTIQTIGLGTIAGDGTGDLARTGGQKINTNFSNLKAAADLVLDVPEGYILGRATASTGDVEQLTASQIRTILELQQQSGFIDRADSTISVVDGTRTFSIAPAVTSFQYWQGDTKYTVSASDDIVFTDVEGLHYFYYDGSTLTHTTTFSEAIITDFAFVAVIYWDATNNVSIILGDERHGYQMDSATHIYNHNTFGTRYGNGLALGNMNTGGTGNAAGDAQFSVGSGTIWDEDIDLVITDGSPQTLSTAAELPVLYRSGAAGDWRKVTATTYPITTTGTGLAAWNQWTGATWQLTEATSGNYVLYHYYATNDVDEPIIAIPGIAQYSSLANAQAAAESEIHSLAFGPMEVLVTEFIPIATVIWETKSSFTNAVKSRTRPTQDGSDYIDWRGISGGGVGGGSGGVDLDPDAVHVNIGSEIQPITLKATPIGADVLLIEDSAATWAKKSITISSIPHDSLSGYVAARHIDWTNATDTFSTTGTISASNFSGSSSGTNTGDQSSIVGITGTISQFNTALTDGSFATGGGTATGTNTGDQTISLTGDVTGSGTGSFAATISNNAVTLAKMADVASGTVFYRKTAATGDPEVQTLATLKTDLGLTGTNSGDQTSIVGITGTIAQFNTALTDGTFATGGGTATGTNTGDQTSIVGITGTIAQFNTACTDATFATGGGTVTGTSSGTNTGDQSSIVGITGTIAQFNTACTDATFATGGGTATGTNTGDQTSIAGITGTKAQFDTACTDGNFLYVGDVTSDTGTPAILSNGVTPSLNTGITGAEVRSLIGAGTGDGTVTSVGTNTGLSGTVTTTGNISLALTNLTTATTELTSTDFVICLDGTAERKITLANFANEMGSIGGWVTSSGVTSVSAGTGMSFTTITGTGSVSIDTTMTAITSMYNTALNVGYSSTTYLDFASTDFSMIFGSVEDFRFSDGGALLANGDITAYSATISSDRNLKENIEPIEDALSKVKKLTGCSFNWKRDGKSGGGLIAQDVQEVMPSAVHVRNDLNTDEEYLTLDYNHVIGLLVQAINELSEKVAA